MNQRPATLNSSSTKCDDCKGPIIGVRPIKARNGSKDILICKDCWTRRTFPAYRM